MTRALVRGAGAPLLAALAMLSGCSKVAPPVAPEPVAEWVPPNVEVTPPARARWVPQDSRIHARWDVPLDTTSIDTSTVYLKIDAKRYGVFYAFDDSGRGLTLTPKLSLQLGRTYTVEITPRVLRADGAPLYPAGWFWQFTITSIRPITTPDPPDAAINTSPFHRLLWNATDPAAGPVAYTLFRGPDSSAVRRRAVTGVGTSGNRFVPTVHWDYNRNLYWAIRAINQKTGQVYESPTFGFRPVPSNAPVDSMILRAQYWGYSVAAQPSTRCNTSPVLVGPTTWTAIKWLPPNTPLRFHNVRWFAQGFPTYNFQNSMTVRATSALWDPCAVFYTNIPLPTGGVLASSERGESGAYLFRGEAWTAHLEAGMRDQSAYGYLITSTQDVSFNFANPRDPTLGAAVLWYYK